MDHGSNCQRGKLGLMLAVSSEISDSDGVAIGFVKGIDWDAVSFLVSPRKNMAWSCLVFDFTKHLRYEELWGPK